MTDKYDRLRTYTVDQVLKFVSLNPEDSPKTVKFAGQNIFMGSKRYLNFKRNGCVCVECGLEGTYFALEKHKYQRTPKYHFNLYGKDANGNEVMLTKDHIMPRAKGGSDELDNFQPMCAKCNTKKGDTWLSSEQEIHKAKLEVVKEAQGFAYGAYSAILDRKRELVKDCPHDICRAKDNKATCSICDKKFGWHCAKSPTKQCEYPTPKGPIPSVGVCKHCGGKEGAR
ncbi:MAG: HNH endonuclease [Candidatus Brocadiales bacterium]|nr:HNH endonuclease [Candidatus Brocadiales bacterium]